jgi:HlyD family secretion protein
MMMLGQASSGNVNPHTPSRKIFNYAATTFLWSLALVGCKPETTPPALVTVQVAKPVVAPISEEIQGDAILSPLAEAALSPKISAPVKKFYVQRGSHVRAGQLLVTLEDRDLQATALDNQGAYTAAQATYQQATGIQLPAATQAAELDLAQAKANLDLNQSIVKGRTQLFQEGAIPGRDLDTAKAALVQAQAAYDTAAQHLHALESVGRATSGQVAQGDLTSAKGKYLNAEALASYASLHSPIDGVVTDRPLFAGEMAPAGTSLITVMDTSSLIAKLHLSQAVTQRLKVGDKAEVTIPGMSAPIEGTASLISPALDPGSTTVEVWVKLKNPDGQLKAGTPVHVAIVGRTVPDALQVPSSALLTNDDGSLGVMVVGSDGIAHMKPVTVGIRLPDTVQILTGIDVKDVVIDTGGYGLQDGTKVKIGAAGDDKSADEDKN